MRSGGTFCPQNEHDLARPHFGGRAKQKKAVAGLSISKESAPTLPLLVMSRFPFSLETSSTSTTGLFEHLAFGIATSSLNVGHWTVFVRLVPIIVEKHTFIPALQL